MIIKSHTFLQPRTSHYTEHELACLLRHIPASEITLHAQLALPFPICLNETNQAVSRCQKGAVMTVNLRRVEREERDGWRDGGMERGQAQIRLGGTVASGSLSAGEKYI